MARNIEHADGEHRGSEISPGNSGINPALLISIRFYCHAFRIVRIRCPSFPRGIVAYFIPDVALVVTVALQYCTAINSILLSDV